MQNIFSRKTNFRENVDASNIDKYYLIFSEAISWVLLSQVLN